MEPQDGLARPVPSYPNNYQKRNGSSEQRLPYLPKKSSELQSRENSTESLGLKSKSSSSFLSLTNLSSMALPGSVIGQLTRSLGDEQPPTPEPSMRADTLPMDAFYDKLVRHEREIAWRPQIVHILVSLSTLFALGYMLAIMLIQMQVQHHLPAPTLRLISTYWLAGPTMFGLFASVAGFTLPLLDRVVDENTHRKSDLRDDTEEEADTNDESSKASWSEIVRYLTGFLGIVFATGRVKWTNNLQLTFDLTLMSVGIWYLFDKTRIGVAFSFVTSFFGTLFYVFVLEKSRVSYSSHEFLSIHSWIPCALFSTCIIFGNIGRKLLYSTIPHRLAPGQQ